jgi:protein phosphatase
VLEIPDPSVVLLVGPAGAGKSTFARASFRGDEILSSDAFRALVSGDEANQRATNRAFALLHRELGRRVAERRLTVVDATNLEHHARRAIARRAESSRLPTVALVLDVPLRMALARNRLRPGRTVAEEVVRRQREQLDRLLALGGLEREGHALVAVLEPAAADAVMILRRPW